MQRVRVADAHVHPGAGVPLVALAHHQCGVAALHLGEVAVPPREREAQGVGVVGEARVQVGDAQDRCRAPDGGVRVARRGRSVL
jgi:hypothetical protein